MLDIDWMHLAAYEEARGEINDGVAGVVEVLLNRTRDRYSSVGTMVSTVTWPTQFSFCEFEMVGKRYTRVARGEAEVLVRCTHLLAVAKMDVRNWQRVCSLADQVVAGRYVGGSSFKLLTPETLLYDNLALAEPDWAKTSKKVVTIDHHTFFEPRGLVAPPRNWTLSLYETEHALS